MAVKSGGTVDQCGGAMDANGAMAQLSILHFFNVKKVNRNGVSGVRVDVTHAGRRVSAERRSFIEAFNAVMAALRGGKARSGRAKPSKAAPLLKLTGWDDPAA
jgi:hypothetical protein